MVGWLPRSKAQPTGTHPNPAGQPVNHPLNSPASLPCSFMSSKLMISAQMKPRSKSEWMAPAACGALVCSRICQQRTCGRRAARVWGGRHSVARERVRQPGGGAGRGQQGRSS